MNAMPPRWRAVLGIAANDLRRLRHDRMGLFFVAVLPFVVIVAIGSFVPSADVDLVLGVVRQDDSASARALVRTLDTAPGVQVRTLSDRRDAERDVRIGQLSAVVVVPEGFGHDTDPGTGGPGADVAVLVDPMSSSAALVRSTVGRAVQGRAVNLTVQSVLRDHGVPASQAEELATRTVASLHPSPLEVQTLGRPQVEATTYAFVAGGQMLLFMFVNSLAAGASLIDMRRLGVQARVLAGPVDPGDVLSGVGLARFVVAGLLAAAIVVMARVFYGVDWGSSAVVVSVVVLFGLIGAGASTLIGVAMDDPEAATSVGIPVGLGMAALGGCMFPLFLEPPLMQTMARILTPHAWAISALVDAGYDGAGLGRLWPNLLVLSLWAAVLITAGRVVAHRRTRG